MIGTWRRRRIGVRLMIASFLLSALVVTGALAASIAVLHTEVQATIRGRLHDRAAALVAATVVSGRSVDLAGADDLLLDSPNWVFDGSGHQLEGSHLTGRAGAAVRRLGAAMRRTEAQVGSLHLLAVPVHRGGRVAAVAVTGVDEAPYLATLSAITRDGVLLGVLAVLGATGLAALVLSRALGPMIAMTDRAAEWSRHRSSARFALGPPRDELTGLAAVLDELLDRVEEALAAERRLTAEIAHELRSPLTLLIGETELALMKSSTPPSEVARYERIHTAATSMARAITALLDDAAAGSEGLRDTIVLEAISSVVDSLQPVVAFRVSGPRERVAVRFVQLERMIAPVLQNAFAAAAERVDVEVLPSGEQVAVRIADDGPGIDPAVIDSLFDPGVTTRAGGTGLGLALARRLVLEAGGDLRLASSAPAVFELLLPRLITRDQDQPVGAGPAGALR
ncbi:HAMP domain-containing sensor histidine kinase [Amnibacterium soli]|uniref:histidine kinase n=1 Tax=Amnibacterium soli TaxID=1282736 RepID=A0ABP8ZB34_9MICO